MVSVFQYLDLSGIFKVEYDIFSRQNFAVVG